MDGIFSGLKYLDPYTLVSDKHLWRDIPSLDEEEQLNVVVEIPAGRTEKWEVRKSDGALIWDFKKGKPIGNAKITYTIGGRGRKPTSIYFGKIKRVGRYKENYAPHGKGKMSQIWSGDSSKGEFKNGLLKKGKMYFAKNNKWINWPEKK